MWNVISLPVRYNPVVIIVGLALIGALCFYTIGRAINPTSELLLPMTIFFLLAPMASFIRVHAFAQDPTFAYTGHHIFFMHSEYVGYETREDAESARKMGLWADELLEPTDLVQGKMSMREWVWEWVWPILLIQAWIICMGGFAVVFV